ncbi:MAG: asparagine synthase C-terminal domain-containing protein, partial [Myxococcota bacterium]
VPRALNRQVLPEFVAFQNVMPPHTLFEGICVLLPGHYFETNIQQDSPPTRHVYWQMDADTMNSQSAPDLEEALITSLEQCWNADRDVGIQLSGGVDSSLVTALSTEVLGRRDVQTYSVIFDDSQIRYYTPRSEEQYIQEVVNRYQVDNESYLFTRDQVRPAFAEAVWYLEAPLHGPSTCLYMLLAKALRDRVTVLLTGEGADDIFLGYFNDWDFTDDPRDLFKMFVGADSISALFGADGLDAALHGRLSLAGDPRLLDMTRLQKATVITVETVLHGLLARHDRMFMSQSIEGRPPFCTDLMVRARFGMADEDVHGKRGGKLAIKRMTERYFANDFVYRKKIGFSSPFGDWCSDPRWWRDYIDKLNIGFLDDMMDTTKLRATLALPEGEQKWSGQNLNLIFTIANLQLWHEIFIESQDPLSDEAWRAALPLKIRDDLSGASDG